MDGAKRFNFQKHSLLHHARDILWTWQLDDVNLTTCSSRASQCELNFHQAHKLGKWKGK
jgi:hypothetical protein